MPQPERPSSESPMRRILDERWLSGGTTSVPKLLCVSSSGAGYDTVDVAACTEAGVLVVNQAGANAQSVAEVTLGLVLDLSRRISESDRRLRRERGFSREDLTGREICGKTLGLVGIGHVGTKVAGLARAFGITFVQATASCEAGVRSGML